MEEADEDPKLLYLTNKLYYAFFKFIVFVLLSFSLPYNIIYGKRFKKLSFFYDLYGIPSCSKILIGEQVYI